MKNKLEYVPFKDTTEKHLELDKVIDQYRDVEGALVQVIKKAQDILGFFHL